MFTPKGPVAGSFQQTLWPRGRASEAAILVSRAFAFVFSWYKAIIALSLCFSSGALQHTVHTSIIAAKIVSLNFFFRASIFWSGLNVRSNKNSNTNPVSTKCRLQTADCTPGTKCRLGTNADCRLGTKCRLRIYTVFSSDKWWHVILQLTERYAIAFPLSSFTIICGSYYITGEEQGKKKWPKYKWSAGKQL